MTSSRSAPPRRRRRQPSFRPSPPPARRAAWTLPLVIFLVAACVRVAVAVSLWDIPLVRTPKLDSAEYLAWAQRLAAGDWTWPIVAQHGPGYPLFLALLLALGSGSLRFAMVVQCLLGAATAAIVAVTARRWFGERAGIGSGLAYALYGPAAYMDSALLGEGMLLFLLASALWALDRGARAIRWTAAAGALLGAAMLVRPTAGIIAVACVIWLVMRRADPEEEPSPPRAAQAAALAAACAIVVLPAVLKTWAASGVPSIQGYGGLNFYIGNSPRHDGRATFRLGAGWDALNSEAMRAGAPDPVAQDRYYLRKALAEIREAPGAFAALLASKALWLVSAEEARDSHSYYFFTGESPLLRLLPRFALLFPLACVGVSLQPRRSLLTFYTAGAALGVLLLVVGFRYRMPFVLALAMWAGPGLDGIVRALSGGWRDAARLGAIAAGAVVVSQLAGDPRNVNTAEEWAFNGSALVTERRLGEAEAAYRRALAIDPQSGLAWDGLGLTYFNSGRNADARGSFDRAIAIDRDNARAIYHRALVDERDGRLEQAADGFSRARQLNPYDFDATQHLAETRRKLATELGMAGRAAEAREQMRQSLELAPANAEAWLDLALLSLDLHDPESATAALDRARQLGADPRRLAFAADALARMKR